MVNILEGTYVINKHYNNWIEVFKRDKKGHSIKPVRFFKKYHHLLSENISNNYSRMCVEENNKLHFIIRCAKQNNLKHIGKRQWKWLIEGKILHKNQIIVIANT